MNVHWYLVSFPQYRVITVKHDRIGRQKLSSRYHLVHKTDSFRTNITIRKVERIQN